MAGDCQAATNPFFPPLWCCWWCTLFASAYYQNVKYSYVWRDNSRRGLLTADGQISRQIPSKLDSRKAVNTKWSNCNPAREICSFEVAAFDLVSVFPSLSLLYQCLDILKRLSFSFFVYISYSCSGSEYPDSCQETDSLQWCSSHNLLQQLFSLKS